MRRGSKDEIWDLDANNLSAIYWWPLCYILGVLFQHPPMQVLHILAYPQQACTHGLSPTQYETPDVPGRNWSLVLHHSRRWFGPAFNHSVEVLVVWAERSCVHTNQQTLCTQFAALKVCTAQSRQQLWHQGVHRGLQDWGQGDNQCWCV